MEKDSNYYFIENILNNYDYSTCTEVKMSLYFIEVIIYDINLLKTLSLGSNFYFKFFKIKGYNLILEYRTDFINLSIEHEGKYRKAFNDFNFTYNDFIFDELKNRVKLLKNEVNHLNLLRNEMNNIENILYEFNMEFE